MYTTLRLASLIFLATLVAPPTLAFSVCFTPEMKQNFVPRLKNFLSPSSRQDQCFDGYGCVPEFEKSEELGRYLGKVFTYSDTPEDVDVHFHAFGCHRHRYRPKIVSYNVAEKELVSKAFPFEANKTTAVIIHGFNDKYDEMDWNGDLKDFILEHHCDAFNVLAVDWRRAAKTCNYFNAIADTQIVALVVASFLRKLMRLYGQTPNDYVLVGHSLGAHIAGFVGANFSSPQLKLIIGLDPAGPGFNDVSNHFRLDPSDARLVVAIHTDKGRPGSALSGLGLRIPAGHYNFLPNGGAHQPGCRVAGREEVSFTPSSENLFRYLDACSHIRSAWLVQTEDTSGDNCQSIGYQCSSYHNFEQGRCGQCRAGTNDCKPLFGFFDVWLTIDPPRARNKSLTYYVDTSDRPNYCIHHYQIIIVTGHNTDHFQGNLKLELFGQQRNFEEFQLQPNNFAIEPNRNLTGLLKSRKQLGRLRAISLELVAEFSLLPRTAPVLEIESVQFNYMSSSHPRQRKALSGGRTFEDQSLVLKLNEKRHLRLGDRLGAFAHFGFR